MGKITSEGIERMRETKSKFMFKVTVAQGNGKYVDKYIQQITSKTIVLIWKFDEVIRLELDGKSRSQKRGMPLFMIAEKSMERLKQYCESNKIVTQHSGFKPMVIDKMPITMIEKAQLRTQYESVEEQNNYITLGVRIIDCTMTEEEKAIDNSIPVSPKTLQERCKATHVEGQTVEERIRAEKHCY